MVRSAAVAVCLLLLIGSAAEAQYFGRNKVQYDRLDFRLLQTEHFDVYYYAEEEAASRLAARMAERWYARFSRLLNHAFTHRQPLVLYASHPHFAQTNLTASTPGEGIGGFTERIKTRIAMPFAAGLGDTDHVLGHEIAHAFQIDVSRRQKQNAFALPGWFIEGMAEYLSLGPSYPHTAMWMRDAAMHGGVPTLKQLENPRYFPYRYGHALWSFLGRRYGDAVVGRILRSRKRNVIERLEEATGLDAAALSAAWQESVDPAPVPTEDGHTVISDERGRVHVGPSLSPDGERLMFLSERDRLSLDLFVTQVDGHAPPHRIVSTAADPHFDSLQYIHSSGAWSRDGTRFAFSAISRGAPVLVVVDMTSGKRQEYEITGLSEIYTPSWSPDGAALVFSGLEGGISDLFVFDLVERKLRRLTADVFADLHPAWSPDGRRIALATDRFTSSVEQLAFGPLRIGVLDLQTGIVTPLGQRGAAGPAPPEPALAGEFVDDGSRFARRGDGGGRSPDTPHSRGKQINPQWSPDGETLYFVADADGISNVFRTALAGGVLEQMTHLATGVSGVTPTSPTLAVAAGSGRLAYSVYRGGRFEIATLEPSSTTSSGCAVESDACADVRSTPAGDASIGAHEDESSETASTLLTTAPAVDGAELTDAPESVTALLADARTGLADESSLTMARYDDRLRLEALSQPYIGAATGNAFGGLVQTTMGVQFGDLLRDRQLQAAVRVGTDPDDFAAQLAYTNQRARWNWGVAASFVPSRFAGARRSMTRGDDAITRESASLRYLNQWAGVTARYHLDRASRLELRVAARRTSYEWQTVTRVNSSATGGLISRRLAETPAGRPLHVIDTEIAWVHDSTVSAPTGPILGQRVRIEASPAFGGLWYTDVRIDARKYIVPVKPITIAGRLEHIGRYGSGASDRRLTPLVAGLQSLVRGYNLTQFAADECGRTSLSCSVVDELSGPRLSLINLEVRAPLPGLFRRDFTYGAVPIEALAFVDAGMLWTRPEGGPLERDPLRSIGAGVRANMGGFVMELTGVRRLDGSQRGWTTVLLMRPGW